MAKFFGGNDPFDHPFLSQPFGGLFGGNNPFDDPFFTSQFDNRSSSRKQIKIEEMNPNDDGATANDAWQNNLPSKELSVKNSSEHPTGVQSFSFQRVAYGGPDGIYYTSSVGKRNGGDGVFLMEMKEKDSTVGESLHTISKGIHDKIVKGHSVTTKQCSDGRVDSLQTLHNLEQDELTGFEENWKTNADKVLPGWSDGFNLLENSGDTSNVWDDFARWGGWPFPSLEYYGNGGAERDGQSSHTKIVPIE